MLDLASGLFSSSICLKSLDRRRTPCCTFSVSVLSLGHGGVLMTTSWMRKNCCFSLRWGSRSRLVCREAQQQQKPLSTGFHPNRFSKKVSTFLERGLLQTATRGQYRPLSCLSLCGSALPPALGVAPVEDCRPWSFPLTLRRARGSRGSLPAWPGGPPDCPAASTSPQGVCPDTERQNGGSGLGLNHRW